MPPILLNDRKVQSLPATDKRTEHFDRGLPGFGLRVTPNGVKSFFVMYRFNRELRRKTLGTYPRLKLADAREKARGVLRRASLGQDPERDTGERTFEALAVRYIEKYAKKKKRSWRQDDRRIRKELNPVWGARPVESITRTDVRDLLERIVERGAPVEANRVLALVRKMFNYGFDQEWLTVNPAHRMPLPADEAARDRVLSDDEIRRFWFFAHEEPKVKPVKKRRLKVTPGKRRPPEISIEARRRWAVLTRAMHLLRLITAQRGEEVLSMASTHISGHWWTIPADVAKNGLAHRVPLTPMALAEIDRLKQMGLLGETQFFTGVRGPVQRRGALDDLGIPDFQPRDLRRTAASKMTGAGVDRFVVKRILNHVDPEITAVYDRHSYDREKREGLMVWDLELSRIVRGE